jgi:hypothetical protein
MTILGNYTIALEEHYYDQELAETFGGTERRESEVRKRLDDLGELRLREMDEAGIDFQVLSHGAPSTQRLSGEAAIKMACDVNDRLHEAVQRHPDRFAGFAALPSAMPAVEAIEPIAPPLRMRGINVSVRCRCPTKLIIIVSIAGAGGWGTPAQLKSTSISEGSSAIAASIDALFFMSVLIDCRTGVFTSPISSACTSAPRSTSN